MRLPPALLLLLIACNDTAYISGHPPEEEESGRRFIVSGVVTDSALGGTIPGARVASGTYVTEADNTGFWSLAVPEGTRSFTSSPAGYERVTETIQVGGAVYLNLMARRLAPMVQECVRSGDRIHAFVTDLQGRKTVERWERSDALIADTAGDIRIGAINWGYEAVDYLTWKVSLGPVGPTADLVHWSIYDSEGHRFLGVCEPAPTGGEQ